MNKIFSPMMSLGAHKCVTLHHISLLMNFIDNVDGNFD